jgi:hypothetical protein
MRKVVLVPSPLSQLFLSSKGLFIALSNQHGLLLGLTGDYGIGSNFWKFYLIRTSFTLGELLSLVKVFRLFRLEGIVLVFRVWTQ